MGKGLSATLVAAGVCLAMAQGAAAQGAATACRASASRVHVTALNIVSEPVRANAPLDPCLDQSASTVEKTTVGPITADAVAAFTARDAGGKGGSSLASVAHPVVALPGLEIKADAVEAVATTGCNGSTPTLAGSSKVVNLAINGNPIALPPENEFVEIDVPGVATVRLNEEVVEGGKLTRRAIHVTTPLADTAVAEAIAGHGAGACTDAGGGGTGGGGTGGSGAGGGATGPNPCPSGASYDPSRNVCIVRESNGSLSGIQTGMPFQGPSGGSVITLEDARKAYKSACLSGPGGDFVIVGTARNDSITGTNGHDRILLLAGRDRAEGGRGDDCIDGGTGVDTMSGALGKDRLIGGSGGDHLVGGSHADVLIGGKGNDTIHTGFGKDRVSGGSGADKINSATAGPPAARLRCGKGRDKIRINRNERRRVRKSGCETVHRIR